MARKDGRRKVISIVIVVVVAVSVASIGYYLLTRGGPSGPIVVEYKTYTNENYSFKFDYPANWDFRGGPPSVLVPQLVAIFTANPENNGGGYPQVSVSVLNKTGYENGIGISLDNLTGYISFIENNFGNNIKYRYYVLISKPTEIVIDNYHGVRYSLFSGPIFAFRSQVQEVVKDNYLLILSMTAPSESYSTYEPIFQHVIDSFSFLKG